MPDYSLGARVRPPDPREDKYRLTATAIVEQTSDLSQPRLLSRWEGRDVRSPVGDQGAMGSCASWAAKLATEMAARIRARRPEPVAAGPLYEQARRLHGWFPGDTGSYVADNLDLVLGGGPAVIEPYVGDAAHDYDDAAWNGKEGRDYEDAHHPFYVSEGSFSESVWLALDAGQPVLFGSFWPDEWFSPHGGVVPALTSTTAQGGHAYVCWGIVPGYFLCQNQWGTGWSADAPAFGHDMRPGDFAIHWESAPLIFEARSVSLAGAPPPPPPWDGTYDSAFNDGFQIGFQRGWEARGGVV